MSRGIGNLLLVYFVGILVPTELIMMYGVFIK